MSTVLDRIEADPTERAAEYAARANLCRLFAGAFAEEPSQAYLSAIRSPQSRAALAAMGARFDADFEEADDETLAAAVACEWTALFGSPGGCAPLESVRLTGRMQQEPFHGVRQAYRRAGYTVRPGRFSVSDDQLGVELAFAACLLDRAQGALERGDPQLHDRSVKELQRFWALHLGRWVRGYAALVECAAMHSFYREMARLLAAFAEGEIEALGIRVEDVDTGRMRVPKADVAIEVDPEEPACNACVAGSTRDASPRPITFHDAAL